MTPATRSIRPLREGERSQLEAWVSQRWGSSAVVSRGRRHRIVDLECLVEVEGDAWRGVAAYRLNGDECELVLLDAIEARHGTGTALLEAVVDRARAAGATRIWLLTTNDNTDALRFYQRRGFRLVAVYPDAIRESRRLKPEIPLVGEHGIPIRDEVELERRLE